MKTRHDHRPVRIRPASSCRLSAGFTLLEIVVAVAILGVAVGVAMQIFSGGLKNIHKMDLAHRAMNHAENVMNEILSNEDIREPTALGGDLDEEFSYQAVVDYYQVAQQQGLSIDVEQMKVYLLSVRVDIHFKNDRYGKLYRTVCLKTVSEEPFGGMPLSPVQAIQQLFGVQ